MITIIKKIIIPGLLILLVLTLIASYVKGKNDELQSNLRLKQVNLTSSLPDYTGTTDSNLTDAWGLEFGHSGRIWVNTSAGFSTVYDGKGKIVMTKDIYGDPVPLAVKIPVPASITDEPAPLTGLVFSETNAFSGDAFVFVTEQGTIAGWHKDADGFEPLDAIMRVDNSEKGAVYKGATSAKTDSGWLLYAANFGQNSIDVFNEKYEPVNVVGGFKDEDMPADFSPFNIKNIEGKIYVSYAKQSIDKANDVAGVGNGYIDVFSTDGKLLHRLASNGELNSPWGMVLAPNTFGALSNYLLVGNFGDGHINVYDSKTGKHIGTVKDKDGNFLQIDGLWSLTFGTDNGAGRKNELFFSAGPSAEDQGLFGKLEL